MIVTAGTVLIRLFPLRNILPEYLPTFLAAEHQLIRLQDWMVAHILMAFCTVEPTLATLGAQLDLSI